MIFLQPLPPKEAIAFFRSKGLEPSFAWQDVWQDEHAKAFTVAKMMNRDLLEASRAALDKAISDGTTFEQFKKDLVPTLKAAGWWGRQKMVDPATGEEKLVQLGSDRRLRTIYEVNLRAAYAHGHWQRIQRNKVAFPFLMYVTAGDARVRPEHRAWAGTCLPVDHDFWKTHYPPCGWRCRCTAIALTRRMAEKEGITDKPISFPPKTYANPRTGEIVRIEGGIDPGFNFNIGKSPLRPLASTPALPPVSGAPPPNPKDVKEASEGFLKPFSATDQNRVVKDKDGWPLVVGPDLFKDGTGRAATPRPDLIEHLPRAGQTLAKPDKIEWLWKGDPLLAPGEKKAIDDLVVNARTKGDPGHKIRLTSVPGWLGEAKTEGTPVKNFNVSADAGAVRHAFQQHADAATEAARGQLPLTADDIRKLPAIVEAASYAVAGLRVSQESENLAFVSRTADALYVLVTSVQRGRWLLNFKTMWKFPAASDAKSVAMNVLNDGGAGAVILENPALHKLPAPNHAAQLVRRYTKRLDNLVVTVDFSKGAWTYDVQPADVPKPAP